MKNEMITVLKYSNTNTYLIEGDKGSVLFDTGWAGTFPAFCAELGRQGKRLKSIDYIVISHFHPDHCGIAQEIADEGPILLICDMQKDFLHAADGIFEKEKRLKYLPIRDEKVKCITLGESRNVLEGLGIAGELLHTPGHSDDSITLKLDKGDLFVGDLNPLYELELHRGTEIERSWQKLLAFQPKTIYYGHAKTAILKAETEGAGRPSQTVRGGVLEDGASRTKLGEKVAATEGNAKCADQVEAAKDNAKWTDQVASIMKYIDKGYKLDKIVRKTGAEPKFIEDVTRMFLTHPGVSVQGILDRIEIKNR